MYFLVHISLPPSIWDTIWDTIFACRVNVGVGSWTVREFSLASSWVSWGLLSIATSALFGA